MRVINGLEQAESRGVEDLGGIEGEKTVIRIYYEKKYLFLIKGENIMKSGNFYRGVMEGLVVASNLLRLELLFQSIR